jgi:hypothetical protein
MANRKRNGRFTFNDREQLTREEKASRREAMNALQQQLREEQAARHAKFDAELKAVLEAKREGR